MRRFRIAALVFLITLASGRGGIPQTGDIILGISETGARRIPVALPDFQPASSAGTQRAAGTITQTLRDDLAFSGYFSVVKPALYSDITGYSENRVLYKDWLGIGAESVVLGKVLEESGKIAVEGRLYDNHQEQLVMGRRYRAEPDAARNIAHRLANEIVRQFTGQAGIFLCRKDQDGEGPATPRKRAARKAEDEDYYTALHPLDFHPADRLATIRPLLANLRP